MSKLVEVLYPVPDLRRTPLSLLAWWESRRPLYNQVVGATGVVTLCAVAALVSLPPNAPPPSLLPLLALSAAYGVMANVCYSLGWLVEVAARLVWREQAPYLGPLLFRQGLIFSVGLTTLPIGLATLHWVARVVEAVLG